MNASQYSFDYLKNLQAALIETKVMVQNSFIGDYVAVNKREYYKKRNGKICYIDYPPKHFPTDWSRIKVYRNHKITSTGDNDWRPLHSVIERYKFLGNYKQELIDQFNQQPTQAT